MAMSDPMEHIQYLEAATVAPGAGADFVASKHAGFVKIETRTARAEQWLDRAATGEASWDGNALVVELRHLPAPAAGAIAAGWTLERNASRRSPSGPTPESEALRVGKEYEHTGRTRGAKKQK